MLSLRYAELCPTLQGATDDVSISLGILKQADIEGFGIGRSKVNISVGLLIGYLIYKRVVNIKICRLYIFQH